MLFIPRDTFWRENARYPATHKVLVQPLDSPKKISITKKLSIGEKPFDRLKDSRPTKKIIDRLWETLASKDYDFPRISQGEK